MNKQLFYALMALLVSSCSIDTLCINKDAFINSFDKFSDDVRLNRAKLNEDDWKYIDKEYKRFVEECYSKFKDEMSLSQKLDFWKNAIAYRYYRDTESAEGVNKLEDLEIDLSIEFEELTEETKEEIEKFVRDELGDDLERALEDLEEGVQSLRDELQELVRERLDIRYILYTLGVEIEQILIAKC